MRSRRVILGLILLTLVATSLAAAAKLRATPKYDRIQVGMTSGGGQELLGPWAWCYGSGLAYSPRCYFEEGSVNAVFVDGEVVERSTTRRGPLERLAWLAGWR